MNRIKNLVDEIHYKLDIKMNFPIHSESLFDKAGVFGYNGFHDKLQYKLNINLGSELGDKILFDLFDKINFLNREKT